MRSCYNSRPIQSSILDLIKEHFMTELRFAARIIKLKNLEIISITIYLWVSENFSERNQIILRQIHMLQCLVKLPIFCTGDFNVTIQDFMDSQWPDFLDVQVLDPGIASTTTASINRKIDFAFVSKRVSQVFLQCKPVFSSPWGPHYSFIFSLSIEACKVEGNALCVPKPFPLDHFYEIWDHLDEQQKTHFEINAKSS